PRHVLAPPLGLEAHAEEADAQRVGHLAHLAQVAAQLDAGLVDVLQRRAGQLQLAGRLQGHRRAAAGQGDDVAALLHRGPAEAGQALEQGLDAALAIERRRAQVVQAEAELLVLGADAPGRLRLFTGCECLHQLAALGDGRIGDVAGARQRRARWIRVAGMGAGGPRCGTISCRPAGHVARPASQSSARPAPRSPRSWCRKALERTSMSRKQDLPGPSPEVHRTARVGWLRAAVLGANDGIVSVAGTVVGVAATGAGAGAILAAGVAATVAGAMSMAAGEYVSVKSQAATEQADIAIEQRELREFPEAELQELAAIYERRGLAPALARQVAEQLTAHDALAAH